MLVWWHRLLERADRYYDQDWRMVWFQPILSLFIFGCSIRLALTYSVPAPDFRSVLGFDFYHIWLGLGMLCPVMGLTAWAMIRVGGRAGVIGRGVRLGGDIGLLTVLLSYHAVSSRVDFATNEDRIFSRYVVAAVMVFVVELIVRDMWSIRLVNLYARAMRSRRG